MAYIGQSPADKGIGLFSQDTFTGDGSTTTFDLSNIAPDGGGNDIQVFVDNVRQQEGSSKAYTLGQDGSGDLKRITFTTAPEASQSIFVLNPGTKNVQQISTVSDNTIATAKLQADAVTTAKILDSNVTTAKIAADAINATRIADDAVSEEHLDVTAVTGHTELSAVAAADDVLLVFDTSSGTLKKIQASNINSAPTISSVSPTNAVTGDNTGNHTFTITGTNFNASATAFLLNNSGTEVTFDSVTRNSVTQITGVIAKSSLTNAGEPFDVVVLNPNGQQAKLRNQINVDASPVFTTAAGTLGTVSGGSAITTIDIVAADPDSVGAVTFEFQSGSIPAGLSSTTVNENGVSKFRITGTPTNPTANTTSNFTLRAVDAASNTTSRAFSITVNRTFTSTSFTSSGTFAVPSGVTSLSSVLVIGGGAGGSRDNGGGGGAGGLIFMPEYPVTPGGTITVTVGDGGLGAGAGTASPSYGPAWGENGDDSKFGAPGDPGLHPSSSVLTAKGGGAGSGGPGISSCAPRKGGPGGSGGGGNGHAGYPSVGTGCGTGGCATQPTQPGDSGAYGFGNPGGAGQTCGPGGGVFVAGGGGGAGAAGSPGQANSYTCGSLGGVGKAYTIADGTTSVFYAGGGAGQSHYQNNARARSGGTGGGGDYPGATGGAQPAAQGGANKGGGAAGSNGTPTATGGKGIVIVRY